LYGDWIIQERELSKGEKIDVICAVYCLRRAEDLMGYWCTAAEEGGVFDIVDAVFIISFTRLGVIAVKTLTGD
jgi:hypothetical protein